MAAQGRLRESRLAAGERRVGWKAGLGTAQADAGRVDRGAADRVSDQRIAGERHDHDRRPVDRRLAQRQARARGRGADRRPTCPPAPTARPSRPRSQAAAPAIEIVDLGDPGDIEQVLAENIFHRAFLFGPFTDVAGADLAAARLTVAQDGDEPQTGIDPATALGDLVEVVRAVADQAPLAGDELRSGRRRHDRLGGAADRARRRRTVRGDVARRRQRRAADRAGGGDRLSVADAPVPGHDRGYGPYGFEPLVPFERSFDAVYGLEPDRAGVRRGRDPARPRPGAARAAGGRGSAARRRAGSDRRSAGLAGDRAGHDRPEG